MGITKQYLKYVSGGNLNLIASSNCNIKFITLENQEGRFVAVGACEHVYIWDLRLSEKVQVISGDNVNVSCLESSSNKQQIAVGYLNGVIKTFNLRTAENISEFIGHNSEITCLAYDYLGHRLVSGSKDTNIIIWDIIAEIGICKLVGHKGIITKVAFMKNYNIVISSSKDTFVKFWDVNTAHNFKTLIDHRSEVWDFILIKNDNYLVTGCNDCELYIWKIYFNNNSNSDFNAIDLTVEDNGDDNYMKYPLRCIKVDKIIRVSKGRLHGLTIDYTEQVIGCYGNDNMIELFHFLSENQLKNKRSKHVKLKRKELDNENVVECEKRNESELDTIIWGKINRLPVIKVSSKVKAIDIIIGQGKELRVCTIVSNNTIELHSVLITENTTESQCLRIISSHGHRTDVRAIYFSSDSLAFVTISGDSVKLWNRPTLRCLRTIESRYALSVIFVPGDRHLIVGLRSGKMLIIDIASGDILEEIPAHQKELWSIALLPTFKGFVTGSEDKTVKFWQFELIDSEDSSIAKVLSVIHYRTLKLEESVLCVKISPNNRFLAISLLDSTVKIFFLDTFKFFISLYGHKLPVLCMDISSDSTLIATGSADRNIKIWGLDFGDCHKSLFAHDDSVTGIAFVPKTHYLFTCGKDGKVKEWDADSFQKIITLPGHTNQAFNCAVSPNGFYIASCGSDKLVRLHERSSEILVLEDESEKEREAQINNLSSEITSMSAKKNQILPTCKTINSEQGAELILECLEICKIYKKECSTVIPPNSLPPLPLVMQLYKCNSIEEFLLETVKRIRVSDLEESLMLIPYYAAYEILKMIPNLMKSYQAELVAKLTLSLIQAHYGPFIRSEELLPQIKKIESLVLTQVCTLRNTLGFNLYALAYIQRGMEEKDDIHLFKEHAKKKKKK